MYKFRNNWEGDSFNVENTRYLSNPFARLRFVDGDDSSDGSGSTGGSSNSDNSSDSGEGSDTFTKAQVDAMLKDAVGKAVTDATVKLEDKNKELLDETKRAKDAAKRWENFDFDSVQNMMKSFEDSEEAKLIAEGKWEEVIAKRIDKQRAEWEGERSTNAQKLEATVQERDTYKTLYENKLTDIQIRAAAEKAGVIGTAIDDIVTRGLRVFSVDKEGNLEARDRHGELVRAEGSELLLTPELFIESLKTVAPHYWPASEGSGAEGRTGQNSGSKSLSERMADAANKGDMTTFKRLREEQRKQRRAG